MGLVEFKDTMDKRTSRECMIGHTHVHCLVHPWILFIILRRLYIRTKLIHK